jgi:CHRD domain.
VAPAAELEPRDDRSRTAGDTYAVAADAKLSDAQFASFQAGNLYVNVHTTPNPGEMRGQLKP